MCVGAMLMPLVDVDVSACCCWLICFPAPAIPPVSHSKAKQCRVRYSTGQDTTTPQFFSISVIVTGLIISLHPLSYSHSTVHTPSRVPYSTHSLQPCRPCYSTLPILPGSSRPPAVLPTAMLKRSTNPTCTIQMTKLRTCEHSPP